MTRSLPRVVFVTRRFWPLLGGAETVVASLSAALVARGGEATVVTAQWQADWPAEIVHRSVRVVRLPQASARGWGTLGYMRRLADWLRENRGEYDLVVASQLKHEAYVAVRCGRRLGFPVVLRASGGGATGDCQWHTVGRCGMRIRRTIRQADVVVAPSPAIAAELIAAGFSAERVTTILNGVSQGVEANADRQARARRTLAAANPQLAVELTREPAAERGTGTICSTDSANGASPRPFSRATLAVYTGRLHAAKGLRDLVTAWIDVSQHLPMARLWLVGDGPEHDALAAQIEAAGVAGRVVLAGSFDHVDDVLAAADLFVLPSHEEGLSIALLEAMAAGLPIVASDIAGNRLAIRSGTEGILVPPGDPAALADAIESLLDDSAHAAALGTAARRRAQADFSLDRMVNEYLALFDYVLNFRRP